ncbi:MAG TPA: hypothetical protein DD435_10135 [Cyanobacteria bacterium UBA8530]|nr:hypothetical protein [Cyanobacteria bacterium UBA8530]
MPQIDGKLSMGTERLFRIISSRSRKGRGEFAKVFPKITRLHEAGGRIPRKQACPRKAMKKISSPLGYRQRQACQGLEWP